MQDWGNSLVFFTTVPSSFLATLGDCNHDGDDGDDGDVHSSYLSQPPQPAVVYFFLAGVLFSIENAKCWPNLANFDQFWLFCREFTEFFGVLFIDLNNAAVY